MEPEIIRRRVAIGGEVRYDTGKPVNGAVVTALRKSDRVERDRFISRNDGKYFFMDLPDGEYIVLASAKGRLSEGEATVMRDAQMNLPMTWLDLEITNR
jgi:Carboxypeptidase regulatory-like domain